MYYPKFEDQTTNMKQTAVEFLLSHIWTSDWVNYTREEKLKVIEQAKEMEKQQERDACGLALSKLLYKQALKSQISDEEIEKKAYQFKLDYENVGVTELEVSAFIMGMKKCREQFKK